MPMAATTALRKYVDIFGPPLVPAITASLNEKTTGREIRFDGHSLST
jgi:hypothetical protein